MHVSYWKMWLLVALSGRVLGPATAQVPEAHAPGAQVPSAQAPSARAPEALVPEALVPEARAADIATRPEMILQIGHSDRVLALQFSADGRLLASGSEMNTKLWNAATGELLRTLPGGTISLTFLPDGRLAASGHGEVRFWDRHTWQCRRVAAGGVALSPDGKVAAGPARSGAAIALTDTRTGAVLRALTWSKPPGLASYREPTVASMTFATDGKLLCSGHEDGRARLWDAQTGKLLRTIDLGIYRAQSVTLSPDGNTLVAGSGSEGEMMKLWDVTTGKPRTVLAQSDRSARALAFSADGQMVATAWGLWDAQTGALLQSGPGGDMAVGIAPDGNVIATSSYRGVHLWETSTGRPLRDLARSPGAASVLAVSPDGKTLALGRYLWDLATGRLRLAREVVVAPGMVTFTPDSKSVVAGLWLRDGDTMRGEVWRWDAATGQLQHSRELADLMALSPGGRFAAIGSRSSFMMGDLQAGKRVGPFVSEKFTRGAFAFAPDGKTFLTCANEGPIELWDAATGKKRTSLQGAEREFRVAAISPRLKYVAACGYWTDLVVWDTITRRVLHRLGQGNYQALAFSPDDATLAAAGAVTRVWDVTSGRLKFTLPDAPLSVLFSPDGKLLIGGGRDGSINLWSVADGRLLVTLQLLPGRLSVPLLTGAGEAEEGQSGEGTTTQWIAFTPDGYYDASPGIAPFLRWREPDQDRDEEDQDRDQLAPAAKYETQMHRADLLQRAIGGGR